MDKKNYMKPTIMVVKLQHIPHLLIPSGGGEFDYIPSMAPEERNKLA